MVGTSCKDAIKNWEAKNETPASESTVVKLYAQVPAIEKMDESLNQLEAWEHLSLSTNSIDRMISLPKLKNLKILSLGRNMIKRIMGLEEIGQTLEQLWMSYNQIEKLDGLQPCIKLHTLFLSNNKISKWDEVAKLSMLSELKTILFLGNPIYGEKDKAEMKAQVVKRIPQIHNVDGILVNEEDRKAAEELD